MAEEEDLGFLTRSFTNPWVSLPYALGMGLFSGMTPATGRMARGLHGGLTSGMAAEQQMAEREKKKRVSEAIKAISSATEPTTVKTPVPSVFSPEFGAFAEGADLGLDIPMGTVDPNQRLSEIDTRLSSEKPRIQGLGGTVSTERTIGVESGGKHYLIPTIINGKQVNREEAIRQWIAGTNRPVGVFGSQEEADRAAGARSERIGREIVPSRFPTEKTVEKPLFTPLQQRYFEAIGPINPEAALTAMGQAVFKPPREEFTLSPGQVRYGPSGQVIAKGPEPEEKMPPSMTEQQALAIEGKVNRGAPLNKRDLALLGTDDPEQAKAIVQEMRRIKKAGQVDTRTALAEALADFKQTQMTGRESQIFRFNNETGQIEDAVSAGLPETEALKKGFRKLGVDDIKTLKRGEATLESLDDFEASARKVLGQEPGIVNMTWQQLETWFKQKQSDPAVILFQTQMTRTLPLMIQSLGLSGGRAGVRMLEIERAALPDSGMTLGAALQLLDRDRKTIRAVQQSVVSGKFGGQSKQEAPREKESADEVRKRLLGR